MKIKISYHSIQSDHILAVPEFTHSEIVEATGLNDKKLIKYISGQTDWYGNRFRKLGNSDKDKFIKRMGFAYTSPAGGAKVEEYKAPSVKKL